MDDQRDLHRGTVLSARGSVVVARFLDHLPDIYSELRGGDGDRIIIEVVNHLDPESVRGVALTPTAGLARGSLIVNNGHLLRIPVGEWLLGRVVNVFGTAIDSGYEFGDHEWRSLRQEPVPLAEQGTTTEIFVTGIKAIDLLAPLERGGQAGLFGGAGVGKTVLISLEGRMVGAGGSACEKWPGNHSTRTRRQGCTRSRPAA